MALLTTSSATLSRDSYELLSSDLGSDAPGAFVIHTTSASLALDEDGICRDAFTLDGSELTDLEHCVGAQFVASVDGEGVTGTPSVGGQALLVDRSGGSRPAVIKTAAITGIVYRGDLIEA